eukprot:767305-Hanusia_phi.AAC.13
MSKWQLFETECDLESRYFDQDEEDIDFSRLEGINISSGLLLSTKHKNSPVKEYLHGKKVLTLQRNTSNGHHQGNGDHAKLRIKKIHQALLPDGLKNEKATHQAEAESSAHGAHKRTIQTANAQARTHTHANENHNEKEIENGIEEQEETQEDDKNNEQSVLYCLPDSKNPLVVLQRLRQNPDSTEFVYLKSFQIDEITPLNPYHLEIVPHNQIPKGDFFTLSSFGVTRFVNGKPDFTELEQWKREHFLFNAILKIPVFKRYRIWKSYKVWRDSVRYGKMRSSAKALNKNLFILNPTFREALLRIRDMCIDLQKVKLYSFQKDTLYTIVHFFEAQQSQRNVVLNHLEEFWLQAIDVAKRACIATLDSLEEGLFGASSVKAQGDQEKGEKVSPRAENFRYTVMASKRVVQRRLYFFLRLCDYVIFNTLHTMVVESTSELLSQIEPNVHAQLENNQKKRKAIFLTEISLILGDLTFVPGASDFENELDSIVGGFVDTVSGSNSVRLLNNEDLEQYTELFDSETEASESSTVSEIVTNDEEYRKLLARIKVAISNAFDACNEYVSIFEPYQTMVIENEQLDEEELRQKAEDGEFVLENFKEKFDLYHTQADNISNLPDEMDCGIMQVNSTKLKTLLSPSPASCLEKLEDILPQLTVAKQRRLLDEVNVANNNLSKKATTVASFVSLLDFVSQCNERKDEIDAEFKELQDHYNLMDENSVEVNSMDRAAFQMLVPEYNQMKNMLDIFESTQDEEMARWSAQLEEDIKQFHHEIEKLRQISQDPQLLEDVEFIDPVLQVCEELKEQANAIEKTSKQNQSFQTIFGQQAVRYPVLEEVVADINLKKAMWEAIRDVTTITEGWKQVLVMEMPVKDWDAQVQKWFKIATRAERELPTNPVVTRLKGMAEIWKDLVPACGDLKNPALQDRHWEKLENIVGFKFERDPSTWEEPFTLGLLLKRNIMQFREEIQRISTEATQEGVLEEMLGKVKQVWVEAEFTLHNFKDHKDVFILAGIDDVQAMLDESMVSVGTILASRYVAGIRTDVEKMEGNLKSLQNVLDEWINVQKNWMYLEPIFSAPDIQRQLPAETKMFMDVDKGLKNVMKKVSENPNCMRIGTQPGQAEIFSQWNDVLERIQKQLEAYLEFKCMAFPRFYFLSNDELLEILAQTRNVQAVQPHMNKCFDGIKSLDFGGQHNLSPVKQVDESSVDIYGIISPENEYVTMGKNLKARGEVENWLSFVEKRMVESLRQLSKESVTDYTVKERHEWVLNHAAQIIIMTSQIYWAKGAEEALDGVLVAGNPVEGTKQWYDVTVRYLTGLINLVRGELSKLQRGSLVALITIDVHNRDIIEYLIRDQTTSKHDFNWQMRIRYYWDDSIGPIGDCRIQQVTAEFIFAHEYLGASFRLVITPLSDRCYMTLTGALQLKLGGAPAGPAGTGKTETTKDLAKALGNQCVVFNCGDNLDYKFMGKFFKGLSQCGAWACFDEFNRINVEVLSVVAQQMITIQMALRGEKSEFEFEGQWIKLQPTFGVFITMNPGYAGRTELPDNLKALFRPMSMMVPDYSLIAEISLFAEGFETAKPLSKKMTKLYKLASEQVSSQPHYDFGMRAIKSVLVMAGSGKRANPDLQEEIVMIRAMCDSNIPKFLKDDVILFNAIVQDLFPGVEIPKQDIGALVIAIQHCLSDAKLKVTDEYMVKCVQLYEVLGIRFGVMQVGPTGSGKTTIARCLAEAQSRLKEQGSADAQHQHTLTYCFNPKSISMGELYGNYNLLTNEWTDGLGSTIIRNANNDQSDDKKFIVFDGPIDAIWIENMNTVLDDNRTLCLPNGERIKLNGATLRMLFEVEDCAVASPATVSRLGVVWIPPEALGLKPPVETWVERSLPEELTVQNSKLILDLFDEAINKVLKWVRRHCRESISSVNNNLIMSCCRLFQSLCSTNNGISFSDDGIQSSIKDIFLFCLVWSIGGNIEGVDGKESFSEYIRSEVTFSKFPKPGTVYDYYYDFSSKEFKLWEDITPQFLYDNTMVFSDILVPTKDSTRYKYLIGTLLDVQRGGIFIGETGTSKSVTMTEALNSFIEPKNVIPFTINFSAQTSALRTQEMLELKFEKRRKGVVGAPVSKLLVCFVDDVNMPAREEYGAQPPIELLRLVIDQVEHYRSHGGIWDRKKLFWSDVVDTVLVAACGPPGGGRNVVTNRFFRFFNMFNISPPSQAVLRHIFASILEGHLNQFPSDCKMLMKPTVDASIEIYEKIASELLPTPAKSHYTFNLRDLSKVFQGILSLRVQNCANASVFSKLWVHECLRVFSDRLIDYDDKRTFAIWIYELLKRKFSMDLDFEDTFFANPILFGDYLKMGASGDDRVYELVTDNSKLSKLFDTYLEEYNQSSPKSMNLIFFMDAIEHVSRLARIIRTPRGNAMLVGLGGSGKQSLTRLAAFMAEFQCFQIELSRGYSNSEFREDLKKLFQIAGVDRSPVVFLFTDSQIVNEGFVEDINSILNAGDVPNLFAQDEKDRVINDCREYVARLGKSLTKDSIYSTFVGCVQSNLHIVLCMSPVGEAFRRRCRMFPSLINCCTIDWYLPWPHDALKNVAEYFIQAIENVEDEHKVAIANMCPFIHSQIEIYAEKFYEELRRKFYITPKSYLDMIKLYKGLYNVKRSELSEQKDRFVNGLNKMEEVRIVIESAKKDLAELEPILKEKSASTEILLNQVSTDKQEASRVEVIVSKEAAEVEEFAAGVKVIQEDARKDLEEAEPALLAAINALNSLTKSDITEVKSFAKPPPLVQTTMEAVCVLLGRKADWENSKKLLGESDFIQKLMNYEKDNIDPKRLKSLAKYISMEDFNPDSVGKVSKAARGLCMWCRAMDVYARVAKEVEPKRIKLAEANAQLDSAMEALNEKKANLRSVQEKVEELEKQLNEALTEKKNLADQAALCEARLSRAGKLTSALGDEQVSWTEQSALLSIQLEALVGNVFLASAFVAYVGPFTGMYRNDITKTWIEKASELKIPVSTDFNLVGVLSKPVEVRSWNISGLPSDDVSVSNGIIVKNTTRWPLLIDPQMQANKWIKSMEEQNGLRLIKLTDGRYLQTIEACVRNGNPLLLEDISEELDPALEPILMKQLFKQGGRLLIRLGEQDIDYDENFRFFITTKLTNPHYLPDVCIKATIINFMITIDGLEDQLLGDVVRKERPDLEQTKDKLVVSMANDKKQLAELQEKVLKLLKDAEGMILDNEPLINTLQQSKITSNMINRRVAEAEETNTNIAEAREGYRAIATRGSLLYFVIADLPNMDPMYQYSLEYFKKLFNICIDASEKADELEKRRGILINFATDFLYKNVCRGLFEKHKLIFSFLICTSILKAAGKIKSNEWNFLLRGALGHKKAENPEPSFITSQQLEQITGIEETIPESFDGLLKHVESNIREWKVWATSELPQDAAFPEPYESDLSAFEKMCLLKIFRQEKMIFSIEKFVIQNLGKSFAESPPIVLADIYPDTTAINPIIFVLSTGSDPTGALIKFAEDMNNQLQKISLGQGQGPVAEKLISQCTKKGEWVCLMNCHLATSWMGSLEKIVEGFAIHGVEDENFRLWLTSMPSKTFPVSVLQVGIKLTNEPPRGMRANLIGSFTILGQDEWDCISSSRNGRDELYWRKLLVGLAFFHAVVQERRKYGPLGWNIRYEFNTSDLLCAKDVLKMFVQNFEDMPWKALEYITGHVNYGGRVTDDQDRRCLMAILETYYKGEVVVKDDSYKFSDSGIYRSPPNGSFDDLMKYLDELPLIDNPEVFGMHDNANIAFQLQESQFILETVLSLQPRVGGGKKEGVKGPEELVDELADSFLSSMPTNLDQEKAAPGMFEVMPNGAYRSLDTVLIQEMDRFNYLITSMVSSLHELRKAIKGLVVMSADLESMFNSFQNNQVPALWLKVAYPCLKPLASWMKDFQRRIEFFKAWCEQGQPSSFWLPGFFYPQGFMTGALQTHARRYQIPIDSLNFSFQIKKMEGPESVNNPPEDGVYIFGLFLEAARWDRRQQKLKPSLPGEMMSLMPIIHFNPVQDYTPSPSEFQAPLYKTNLRAGVLSTTGQSTNYILDVGLATDEQPRTWVLMATALVCMTND